MARDSFEVDDTKSAKFNAGVLMTERVNEIQRLINFCKNNPKAFNEDYQEWNFNLWFANIDTLYDEIDGFLSQKGIEDSKQQDFVLRLRKKIREIIEKYPIMRKIRKDPLKPPTEDINEEHWKVLKKAFEYYERIVRRYGLKYKILAATIEDDLDEI